MPSKDGKLRKTDVARLGKKIITQNNYSNPEL